MDCALVHKYLIHCGWQHAADPGEADVVLFNACGLTDRTERDSIEKIRHCKELTKPNSQFIIWGCLPKIHSEALQEFCSGPCLSEDDVLSQIDSFTQAEPPIAGISNNEISSTHLTCPTSFAGKVKCFLKGLVNQGYLEAGNRLNLYRPGADIYYIKTCSGCVGHCTYCAVRLSRGTVRSKSLDTVVAEFRVGLALGYREFSLMGTDVGCYGFDKGYTVCELLREIVKEKGDYKIGIRNINPRFMKQLIDGLEPILKEGRIWFLGMPAESGSNRILKLMGRGYTAEEYREYHERLKVALPDLVIRNQIMAGFPTETPKDFAASMNLIKEVGSDYNEVYPFSARPGTGAAKLKGQVPSWAVRLRYYKMYLYESYKMGVLRPKFQISSN